MKANTPYEVVTVTLNPAIDQTLIIPDFAAGKVNRVKTSSTKPGGKGVNVAATLADVGVHAGVTGFLGDDNSEIFETFFSQKKIGNHFIKVKGVTRTGLKILDSVNHVTTDINFPGLSPRPTHFDALKKAIDHLAETGCNWFVISGSLPPSLPATACLELVHLLKKKKRNVVLDTSDEPFRLGIQAVPTIVKPNRHELATYAGHPLPTREAVIEEAQKLLERGVEMVVVSMDKDGALFLTRSEAVFARPPNVQVNSTVGAGDAMVAGIMAAQLRNLPLAQCALMATAFSLDLLTKTSQELTSRSSIKLWMKEVTVEKI